jgi:hypothetical protein
MQRLELLILQLGERHWDAFTNLDGYVRSLTRRREVQHDFETRGLQRRALPSETFAQLILLEHHDATTVDAAFIPTVSVQTWRQSGLLRVRILEHPATNDAFQQIPTEMKARSFRSLSSLRLSVRPEQLEDTVALFKGMGRVSA